MSTNEASEKAVTLEHVLYVKYPVQFRKNKTNIVKALINSGSEVNFMHSNYAKKLGLPIEKTDVRVRKIDGLFLGTFGMVIAGFQIQDKLGQSCFFQQAFL